MQDASCSLDVEISVQHSFLLSHFCWDSYGLPFFRDIHSAMKHPIPMLPLLYCSDSVLLSLFASFHLPSSSLSHILPFLKCVFPGALQACLMGSILSCDGSLRAAYVQHGASPGLFPQGQHCRPSSTKTSTLAPTAKVPRCLLDTQISIEAFFM